MKIRFTKTLLLTVGISALGFIPSAQAVTVLFLNDFESGTTQFWGNGGPAPDPQNITTGGPLGANDHFLQISSDGVSSGGKIVSFNRDSTWLGNYVATGVTGIRMDLKNMGAVELTIRIAFKGGTSSGSPGYASTTGFILPADGNWYGASFGVNAASMTGINSPGAFDTFMTNPAEFRILNSTTPSLNGTNVVSALGVDNITAIPEPAPVSLLLLASGLLAWRRRAR